MIDFQRLEDAYSTAVSNLLDERVPEGHWVGQLSTSALSTATAASALSAYGNATGDRSHQGMVDGAIGWLVEHQNDDGGWGDTLKSYSNIATTMLARAAFFFAGQQDHLTRAIQRADEYIQLRGGVAGLRARYGTDKTFAVPILANCAMAGSESWKEVAALPFEAACVPQRFYHLLQLPVVSYAIPALVAIGQAKFFHDPPWNPLTRMARWFSVGRSLKVLQRMQPASGGFLEAIPLTSFVVMGLATSGKSDHPVVKNGIRFIKQSILEDGSWPIDTNLATWTTTLSVNSFSARADASTAENVTEVEKVDSVIGKLECTDWILSCQNRVVHPFTQSPPGGWGWTDLSGAVPDADDTPGALLAIRNLWRRGNLTAEQRQRIRDAANLGVEWLLKLQNRDRGWPTFCRGWGKLPFDRSGADITAHCLRGIHAWRGDVDIDSRRIGRATERGLLYLSSTQRSDGSWLPLWFGNQDREDEENPVYGTAKVLAAYKDLKKMETAEARRGLEWLVRNQNPDGSWGGGRSNFLRFRDFGLGRRGDPGSGPLEQEGGELAGSVEETALALEALLFAGNLPEIADVLQKGVGWMLDAVETDCYRIDWPIGFYFAKLWYHERLYPQVFTVAALGRALGRYGQWSGPPLEGASSV
ncbi:MAG: prenyltransferase/squalene oxidase repeat-containing protein [Planctomycetota bacterium]|nr:prenyltransferase/squalene oxidase repeat-containing protein [Planctomycetota bacterium]